MTDGIWILLLCAALGALGRNMLIAGGALLLIGLRFGHAQGALRWLDAKGITLGIFILVLSLLVPVANERISLRTFVGELIRPSGLIGLAAAAGAAYLGRGGVDFLQSYPAALVGMLVGSVVGTILLRGVPTGPLIAAGATALVLRVLRGG